MLHLPDAEAVAVSSRRCYSLHLPIIVDQCSGSVSDSDEAELAVNENGSIVELAAASRNLAPSKQTDRGRKQTAFYRTSRGQ